MVPYVPAPQPEKRSDINREFRAFLQLVYSLCKQYVSWYEKEIKIKV